MKTKNLVKEIIDRPYLKWIIMFIIMLIIEKHIYGNICFLITLIMNSFAYFLCEKGLTKASKTKNSKISIAFLGWILYHFIIIGLLITLNERPSILMNELEHLQTNVLLYGGLLNVLLGGFSILLKE